LRVGLAKAQLCDLDPKRQAGGGGHVARIVVEGIQHLLNAALGRLADLRPRLIREGTKGQGFGGVSYGSEQIDPIEGVKRAIGVAAV
jgi:hypothetical protein